MNDLIIIPSILFLAIKITLIVIGNKGGMKCINSHSSDSLNFYNAYTHTIYLTHTRFDSPLTSLLT